MTKPLYQVIQWMAIMAVSILIGSTIGSPIHVLWAFNFAIIVAMVGLTRGNLERMLSWFFVIVVFINFAKRALFLAGPIPQEIYQQIQAMPLAIMSVLLFASMVRLSRRRLQSSDILVGIFFMLGAGITMARAAQGGEPMQAAVSLMRASWATLCYYVGRALCHDVWVMKQRLLQRLFWVTLLFGVYQLVMGPTFVDICWAQFAENSMQGAKVLEYFDGLGEFRPYSTFSDPLAWGFFITFVWCVIEGIHTAKPESAAARFGRRLFFCLCLLISMSRSCLLSGAAMLMFSALLLSRLFSRPVVFVVVFTSAFVGIVYLIQYLLENVLTASWFPMFTSLFLHRFLDIGTLTQRGYAIDELLRALKEYSFVGVGWFEHSMLTSSQGSAAALFQSHNGIVSLIVVCGLPGFLAILGWFVTWLRQISQKIHAQSSTKYSELRWAAAMVLGFMATVFFSGPQFMNEWFWIMVGWSTTVTRAGKQGDGVQPGEIDGVVQGAPPS